MELIHYRGLNCYFDCVATLAAHMGICHEQAYLNLLSETELTYDKRLGAYSSKRIIANMAQMGIEYNCIGINSEKHARSMLSRRRAGDWMIIGMDGFHIPWSPIHQALHDNHYFIAKKEADGSYLAFDPTYGRSGIHAEPSILIYAYDICLVEPIDKKTLCASPAQEGAAVIAQQAKTKARWHEAIDRIRKGRLKEAIALARYTDAITNHRYLYKHYLTSLGYTDTASAFTPEFFHRWEAVKSGLYKASLLDDNEAVLKEAEQLLNGIMADEIAIAHMLMQSHPSSPAGITPSIHPPDR